MTTEELLRLTNRNMVAFDLALGSAALLAPDATLRALGPRRAVARRAPPVSPLRPDLADLRRRPPGRRPPRPPEDWWALAWLRGTELATDIVWSRSAAFIRPGARAGMWFAGALQPGDGVGFARLARERSRAGPGSFAAASAQPRVQRPAADREADLARDPLALGWVSATSAWLRA